LTESNLIESTSTFHRHQIQDPTSLGPIECQVLCINSKGRTGSLRDPGGLLIPSCEIWNYNHSIYESSHGIHWLFHSTNRPNHEFQYTIALSEPRVQSHDTLHTVRGQRWASRHSTLVCTPFVHNQTIIKSQGEVLHAHSRTPWY